MLFRTLIAFSLLLASSIIVEAQIRPAPSDNRIDRSRVNESSDNDIGSPEDEMRARNEIKLMEKERSENMVRAREAAQLGEEIRQAYARNRMLSPVEMKKLERMEKLARRVRNRAGGSDDDETLEKVPVELESALNRLAETSVALSKGVEKTPRMVISASVIERANELIEIIRFVRTNIR
jgi:hypothetical protein